MESITPFVLGGLCGLVAFAVAYSVIGLFRAQKKLNSHQSLIEAIARENESEHLRIHEDQKRELEYAKAEIGAVRREIEHEIIIQMKHDLTEMHRKIDRIEEALNMRVDAIIDDTQRKNDQVYRDMDSRLDKMEARITKKRPSKAEKLEQINS